MWRKPRPFYVTCIIFFPPSYINEAHPVWFHRDMSVTLYFDNQSWFIWCRCSPWHLFSLQWFCFLVHFFTNTNQVASAQTEIRLFVTDDENGKVYPSDFFKPYILSMMYFFSLSRNLPFFMKESPGFLINYSCGRYN